MPHVRVRVLASSGFQEWTQTKEMHFEIPDWPDPLIWVSWEVIAPPCLGGAPGGPPTITPGGL